MKFFDTILAKLKSFWQWILKLDWSNPRVVVTGGLCVLLPFVAYSYVMMGLLIGAIMALEVLWLVEKLPNKIRIMIHKYPLAADIALTAFGAITLGGLFGTGLTLAMGAAFCAVILDMAVPHIKISQEEKPAEVVKITNIPSAISVAPA